MLWLLSSSDWFFTHHCNRKHISISKGLKWGDNPVSEGVCGWLLPLAICCGIFLTKKAAEQDHLLVQIQGISQSCHFYPQQTHLPPAHTTAHLFGFCKGQPNQCSDLLLPLSHKTQMNWMRSSGWNEAVELVWNHQVLLFRPVAEEWQSRRQNWKTDKWLSIYPISNNCSNSFSGSSQIKALSFQLVKTANGGKVQLIQPEWAPLFFIYTDQKSSWIFVFYSCLKKEQKMKIYEPLINCCGLFFFFFRGMYDSTVPVKPH